MSKELLKILEERKNTHGDFIYQAAFSSMLKEILRKGEHWNELKAFQTEALDMIVIKIARILTGDPNYKDSWLDIAGYAELVAKELK